MTRLMLHRMEMVPGVAWTDLARRVWVKVQVDNVFGRAAELAYFFLFSLFPLAIVLTTLLGLVSIGADIRGELLLYCRTALPPSAYHVVADTLRQVRESGGGGKLSLGVVVTIASASAGMVAVIEGLDTAYQVREARSWLRRRGLAIVLTLALALFTVSALAIFLYGDQVGAYVAAHVGFKPLFETAWPLVQWPLVVSFVLGALSLTYRFAPNVRVHSWRGTFPGAVAAFLVWLVASAGLRVYLKFFNTYSAIYGSLGALMILMVWFYLFGVAILVGGEVNSVLETAAAQCSGPHAALSAGKARAG